MDAEQFPQPLLTGSFFILMKILISILFHPPSFAVDVMLMSVCQSNDCSFSGWLPSPQWKRATFPRLHSFAIDPSVLILVLEPMPLQRFMSCPPRSWGGKWNIASGQIFAIRKARDSIRSQTQRGELGTKFHSTRAKSMAKHRVHLRSTVEAQRAS